MKKIILLILLLTVLKITFSQSTYYLEGSTKKISQLVGDYDRQLKKPTNNLTETNYQIWGTDLGVPFSHKGKTYILFGDSPGDHGFGDGRDPYAYTEDTNPEDGLDLTFFTHSHGLYLPVTVPGKNLEGFQVPMDGISVNNIMYLYAQSEGKLFLAKSNDDGKTFELVIDVLSSKYFNNVSVNKVERSKFPGMPGDYENGILLFGTGDYRNSAVYMYCQNEDSIEYKSSIYYFAGFNGSKPTWTKDENNAEPVHNITCGGEISFAYNPHLQKWLGLYNCGEPRGINYTTADNPWGPYTEGKLIFDPWLDNGYCHFIHTDWNHMVCDTVNDLYREYEWGGEYGPYMFKDFTTIKDSLVTIYYTLSTWNPYTVVLMKSILVNPDIVSNTTPIQKANEISLYPNPTTGQFTIDMKGIDIHDAILNIVDINGRIVHRETIKENAPTIDVGDINPGMYFVKIEMDKKNIFYKKLVISR